MQPLPITGPMPLVRHVITTLRAWRWQRNRQVCTVCAACSSQLEDEAARLLSSGHYRAAVAIVRLSLELVVRDLYGHFEGKPLTIDLAYRLVDRGIIVKPLANRVSNLYGQASRVVHGRACTRGRAVGIVRDIRLLSAELLAEQHRYATGVKKGGDK